MTAASSPERSLRSTRYGWNIARFVAIVVCTSLLATTFVTDKQNPSSIGIELVKRQDMSDAKRSSSVDSSSLSITNDSEEEEHSDNDGPWPRIAWLMSFPNSGTSYTGQLVKHLSQLRMASNYGEQNLNEEGNSVPVYDNDWNGPFYVDPDKSKAYQTPTRYVLTKTHCGGYRTNAGPEQYVESTHSFRRRCFGTKHTNNGTSTRGEYKATQVAKAIHLIRCPMDNIVSRFHLELNKLKSTRKPTLKSFRAFCRIMDDKWKESERNSIVYDDSILQLAQTIPCHADFFRYVEWHNLAFVTTRDLDLDTLVLHYEDYATRFNATTTKVLDFLELDPKGDTKPFVAGKEYSLEYFTVGERLAVKELLEQLALRVTWTNLKHYFD